MGIAGALFLACAAAWAAEPVDATSIDATSIGATAVDGALRLTLKQEAQVAGSWVKLGDVAELEGLEDARLSEIAELKLSHVPLPGVVRIMEQDEIAGRLRRLSVGMPVVFSAAPASVRVSAAVRTVSGRELAEFGLKFLEARAGAPGWEVKIEPPANAAAVSVPDVEISMVAETSAVRLVGLVPVAVEVWAGDKRIARRLLSYRLHARAPVLQAARDLDAGAVLTDEDVTEQVRDLSLVSDDSLSEAGQAVGQKLVRQVSAGSVLRRNDLARPLEVKQGASVILLARVGPVEARAEAVAKSGGASGDLVTVVNKSSRRSVQARVVEPGIVEAVLP